LETAGPNAEFEMEETWKMAHELRAHVREAQVALRQNEIEHRQLDIVRRLEEAVAEAREGRQAERNSD
jgi:hypothetical protein